VLGFVLVLEYVLATWLIVDGPLGAVRGGPPRLNMPRTAVLVAIVATATVLHLRSRPDGKS
jgi:hypothetical protein